MTQQPTHIPLPQSQARTPASSEVIEPSKAVAVQEDTHVGFATKGGFEMMQRAANLLSSSTLVPKEFQKNLPNCVIALNMANRIGADPLMVMQNLYVVHGRPSWSAQFLIATFNTCGRFSAMRFEFFGEKGTDSWGCRAFATEKATGERLVGPDIDIALSKAEGWFQKTGSKWKTMPQQMLMYRAASWFVRGTAPELGMGLQTSDEIEDIGGYTRYDRVTDENLRDDKTDVIDVDGVVVPEKEVAAEPEKSNLEAFKEKHSEKPKAEKKKPEADNACQSCQGSGVYEDADGKGPCAICAGTGKAS